MKDRQPLKPGRINLVLDNGTVLSGVMERADEPTVGGDPLCKNTFLKDSTAMMLGGDPETMLPDDALRMLAGLAASGGSGSGGMEDLDDTAIESGSFVNSGAGWNTFRFRESFDTPPNVVLSAEDFDGTAQLKSVTVDGFLYCLRQLNTGSYYTADSAAASSTHTPRTFVNGTTTTAASIKINYIAIEYGGER